MKSLNNFNKYLNNHQIPVPSDSVTKNLIIGYYDEQLLKEKWSKILHKEHKFIFRSTSEDDLTTQRHSKKRRLKIIGLITSIAACFVFGWLVWIPTFDSTENKLQALLNDQYANPVPRELMKGPESINSLAANAYGFYQAKEYSQAIPIFNQLIAEVPLNEEHHFYLGLSYLYDDQPLEAATEFEWVLAQLTSSRKDAATWYLALSLADAEEFERARIYLKEVSTWDSNVGKTIMANEAKALLDLIQDK